jgi:hypothetical protein
MGDDDNNGELLAVALVQEMPTVGGSDTTVFDVRQLALALLLEANGPMRVDDISRTLGVGLSTTIAWIEAGEKRKRFERYKDHIDHRHTWVRPTARGIRERKRTRGKKGGPNVQRGTGARDSAKSSAPE